MVLELEVDRTGSWRGKTEEKTRRASWNPGAWAGIHEDGFEPLSVLSTPNLVGVLLKKPVPFPELTRHTPGPKLGKLGENQGQGEAVAGWAKERCQQINHCG